MSRAAEVFLKGDYCGARHPTRHAICCDVPGHSGPPQWYAVDWLERAGLMPHDPDRPMRMILPPILGNHS